MNIGDIERIQDDHDHAKQSVDKPKMNLYLVYTTNLLDRREYTELAVAATSEDKAKSFFKERYGYVLARNKSATVTAKEVILDKLEDTTLILESFLQEITMEHVDKMNTAAIEALEIILEEMCALQDNHADLSDEKFEAVENRVISIIDDLTSLHDFFRVDIFEEEYD